MGHNAAGGRVRTWAAVVVLVVGALLARRSLVAPAADPERRAGLVALHRELFTDEPRYTGSAEAEAARGRLRAALDAAGCETSVVSAWSCGKRACAHTQNVWCRVGPATGEPILGMAHTDSVAAGPGAADDASGVVAWVDTVRRLDPATLQRPLVLVLTDAEEPGLLGARAWFAAPPVPPPYHAVVNLEARGTTGAAFLFQTVGPTRPWGTWAARLPTEPRASSLYPTVYSWIPNDTDLTIAARHPGVNHAFLGELPHYHTVHDDLAHLDPDSLAHVADLAAGWVHTLQDPPEGPPSVFTDVYGLVLLRWPRAWAVALAAAAALGVVGVIGGDLRAGRATMRDLARAALGALLAAAAALGAAEGVGALVRAAGDGAWCWPSGVVASVVALSAAAWVGLGAVATPLARWGVAALALAALALAGTAVDPGFGVLALPAVAVALAGRLLPEPWGSAGALVGATASLLPIALGLPDALGLGHPGIVAAPLSLVLLAATPLAPPRPGPWAAALGVAGALFAGGVALAPPNPERPLPVNVAWDDTLGERARLHERTGEVERAAVTPLGLPPPALEWVGPTALRVTPTRGGRLEVSTPTPYVAEGQAAPAPVTDWWGVPPEGLVFRFAEPPTDLRVRELTVGLPPGVTADRGPAEVAAHKGDRTITHGTIPPR